MSRKSNHVFRPSGLRQSADGKYIYANCVITGKPTFFKLDYFAAVLARDFVGDENKMAKGYVCKDVKNLRKLGKTDEQILKQLGKFDPKAPKVKKHPEQVKADKVLKPKKVKKEKVAKVTGDVVETVQTAAKADNKPVYPWQGNPDYFRSVDAGAINFTEATKETCFRPDLNLDRQCAGCPLFDRCTCVLKIEVVDREKAARRSSKPVERRINLVAGCFDEPTKV